MSKKEIIRSKIITEMAKRQHFSLRINELKEILSDVSCEIERLEEDIKGGTDVEKETSIPAPKGCHIFRLTRTTDLHGDNLFIPFNDEKQLLGWTGDQWNVLTSGSNFERIDYVLKECQFEDLKVGDTAVGCSDLDHISEDNFYKIIDAEEKRVACLWHEGVVSLCVSEVVLKWCKVIPIE